LLPQLNIEMPKALGVVETRFDLTVNNAPANQVFMAIVSGTRYSMLVHPDIKEALSVNLKDVTVNEALEAIRELYGYEFKFQGNRIYVQPVTVQTRLFQVNYLASRRVGRAEVSVKSGSITSGGGATTTTPVTAGAGSAASVESSRVTTTSNNDYWTEISDSIKSIIGATAGRTVVVNPTAGVILVNALPSELRLVEQYLKAMSMVVERQVMLEAKIIDVTLSDQYATGINWAAFPGNFGVGMVQPGTTIGNSGPMGAFTGRAIDGTPLGGSNIVVTTGANASMSGGFNMGGSVVGLAFQASSFAALLNFLEGQGTVQVLSSPRIATLNNQKAVIKVGTDEFFVTNISTTTTSTGTTSTVSPTITTQPFFSGIALDVTPQISDDDQITLHVHPSVSLVTDKTKSLSLGALGSFVLPLASSSINESDTIVRVRDGTIAAIGGLMRQSQSNISSGLPGTSDSPIFSSIFGNVNRQLTKSELVILLKVTLIKGDVAWQEQAKEVNERIQSMRRPEPSNAAKP
jgi:MSHA biogenesis protein MshL